MDRIKRICLWSGPRNISTALMYSFAQRNDTKVFDEPLYAYYLENHPEAHKYHPGTEDILESMENDGEKVGDILRQTTYWRGKEPGLFDVSKNADNFDLVVQALITNDLAVADEIVLVFERPC